jgi:hypothetical protein
MLKLPKDLPEKIKRVLKVTDLQFDAQNRSEPFYFASYSEVKMQGWHTAEKNLKKNLTKILEIIKQDEYLEDRENKMKILTLNIESLDLSHDFYSEAFLRLHRTAYLRTVRKLTRAKRPKSYQEFRYTEIGKLRKFEPIKKVRRKITIPDEETQITYKAYLIDFKKQYSNHNIKEYKQLFRKINPENLIRHPISEVYEFFGGEVKLIYKKNDIRKNSLEKEGWFLRELCYDKSRNKTNQRFTPFGYIAVPDFLQGDEKEIMISTGIQVGSLAGSGGADYYQRKGEQYVYKSSLSHWIS